MPLTELAVQTLRQRGRLTMRVTGTSMLPSILPSDIVFVQRCDAQAARRGEIVVFQRGRRLYVHRVTACREGALITQGDANPEPDAPVQPLEFLGKVVRQFRGGKAFRPESRFKGLTRAAAALFRRSSSASRWFTRAHAMVLGRA
jgi:signal peptidase I